MNRVFMNPVYTVLESPHRWLILAGSTFVAALAGGMAMIAWNLPHWVPRFWFYAGFFVTVYCLVEAYLDWRQVSPTADKRP